MNCYSTNNFLNLPRHLFKINFDDLSVTLINPRLVIPRVLNGLRSIETCKVIVKNQMGFRN